jgi:hypothetical protein
MTMASKRVVKSLINTANSFKIFAADGANSSGGIVSTAISGALVGQRVLAIFGHVKANTGAHTFLIPVIGTAFESYISVAGHIQQLVAAGDLSLNTYIFILEPAKSTMQRP